MWLVNAFMTLNSLTLRPSSVWRVAFLPEYGVFISWVDAEIIHSRTYAAESQARTFAAKVLPFSNAETHLSFHMSTKYDMKNWK